MMDVLRGGLALLRRAALKTTQLLVRPLLALVSSEFRAIAASNMLLCIFFSHASSSFTLLELL